MPWGGGGWDFLEDLVTVEVLNTWKAQGSSAGGPKDSALKVQTPGKPV